MRHGFDLSPESTKRVCGKIKSGQLRPLFTKEAMRKGNLSGKAMRDAIPAYAGTHGKKKSHNLEEG